MAFAAAPVRVLCSYDSAQLDPAIIRSAMSTHPVFVAGGTATPSPAYDAGRVFPDEWNQPLRRPPDGAAALAYRRTWPRSGRMPPARPPVSACPRTASST